MYIMTARITKLLLLFSGLLLSLSLAAQYPNNPIKSRLGWQTTGDGLVYRGSGAPAYSPGTLFNAWMYLDTTNYTLYMYKNFQWTKLPLVNNGLTLDGSYVQLGGTLVENTTVERSMYTLDFGKISGSNNGYLSFYGTDPHYVGMLTTKDGTESGLTIGNKLWGFEVDDSDHVSTISGSRFGFDATYLGTLGVSQFKMDSTKFFIKGLPSFASHTAADAGTNTYQMYMLDNSRRIYVNQGTATSDILGTGTATRIPIWTSTNALGDSPILYNSTTKRTTWDSPGIIELPMGTDAQRPTATTSDFWYNTTGNGIEWYNGSRWAKGLESTFNRGTATYIPYFDSNGQLTENINHQFVDSPTPKLVVPNGSSTVRGIEFYNSNLGGGASGFRQNNNVISIIGNDATRLDVGNAICDFLATNATFKLNSRIIFNEPTTTALQVGQGYRAIFLDPVASGGTPRVLMFGTANSANTKFSLVGATGFLALNMGATDARYQLETISTNAWGFPRGTVAQRPTITASTSPMRFNTDSTAFEYGESVGVWRLLASRTYARSLVSGLSPDTWLGTRLNAGNVDINANGNTFQIDSLSNFLITSQSTAQLGGAYIEQKKWLNTSKTKYFSRGFLYDSRSAISGGMPAFYNLLTVNEGSGESYEWANEMIYDTTNNVYVYGYGGRYGLGYLKFNASRSNVAGVYLSVPRFHFFGTNAPENATNDTYHTMWGASSSLSDIMMGLKDGGKFLIASDSTFIFDPSVDMPQLNKAGQGNKEAADLSKTQSNYIAGFATDGTVLDLERKRDTTIFVTADTDYDFSAAVTTAQISRRYNRIIIHMTLTSGVGADKTTTLHAPDANLMQCEILIRGTDNTGTYDNEINFGTNNAISSDGTNVSGYTLAQGQGLHVRVVYNGSAYKYIYY